MSQPLTSWFSSPNLKAVRLLTPRAPFALVILELWLPSLVSSHKDTSKSELAFKQLSLIHAAGRA